MSSTTSTFLTLARLKFFTLIFECFIQTNQYQFSQTLSTAATIS